MSAQQDTITGPQDPMSDMFSAIEAAEAGALADHRAGRCDLSEWSCSHCAVSA